jgi:hypothetical protein
MWWVGVSRFRENFHQIEDIVAGWFLGTMMATWALWQTAITQRNMNARFAAEYPAASGVGADVNGARPRLCRHGRRKAHCTSAPYVH